MVEKLVRTAIAYKRHGFEDPAKKLLFEDAAKKTLGLAEDLLKDGVPWSLDEGEVFYHPKFVYFPNESRIMGKSGQKLELTPTENRILGLLADNVNRVVSHPNFSIALGISGKFSKAIASLLRQHIHHLRDKIELEDKDMESSRSIKSCIRSVRGEGYVLVDTSIK